MAGSAEQAILAAFGDLSRQIANIAAWPRPPYDSASAFRFVYDRSTSRDTADASAVSQHLRVLKQAVTEQQLLVPVGPEPGTAQARNSRPSDPTLAGGSESGSDAAGAPTKAAAPASTEKPDGAAEAKAGQGPGGAEAPRLGTELPSGEALLSQPATVAGREWAELACRALARNLHREAEELFLTGAEQVQTDPFAWFGAGLAAAAIDVGRAIDHFSRASRYLAHDDPAGAVHVDIVVGALMESIGHRRDAVLYLERKLGELGGPEKCPYLCLHLARLDARFRPYANIAVDLDPLLDIDAEALGLDLHPVDVRSRADKTREEIRLVYQRIDDLSKVDPQRPHPIAHTGLTMVSDDGPLHLSRLEVQLWRAINDCRHQIDRAREAVVTREQERERLAAKLASTKALAGQIMTAPTVLAYLLLSLVLSAGIVLTAVIGGRLIVRSGSSFAAIPVGLLVLILVLLLIGLAVAGFVAIVWPEPGLERWPPTRYKAARKARDRLDAIDLACWNAYEQELLVRRRFDHTTERAELAMNRIISRRQHLVPARPSFKADDLPVVAARAVTLTA